MASDKDTKALETILSKVPMMNAIDSKICATRIINIRKSCISFSDMIVVESLRVSEKEILVGVHRVKATDELKRNTRTWLGQWSSNITM